MSKIIRCTTCKGNKQVMGMGGLQHKCKVCSGIGYQEVVDEKDEDDFLSDKPKRGRKSKIEAA